MYSIYVDSVAFANCLKLAELSMKISSYPNSPDAFLCGVHMSVKDGKIQTLFASNNHAMVLYNSNTFESGAGQYLGGKANTELNYLTITFKSLKTVKAPNYKSLLKNLNDTRSKCDKLIVFDVWEDGLIYKINGYTEALPLIITGENRDRSYHRAKGVIDTCLSSMNFAPVSIPGMQIGGKGFRDFLFSKTLLSEKKINPLIEMYRKKDGSDLSPMFTTLTDARGNECFFINMPCLANLKNDKECQKMFSPFADM